VGYPHKDKKSYVFTQTASGRKREKDQNVHFIANVIEFAKELIHSPGKDIWILCGADIISIFLNAGLLDEIILSIHPIMLGNGIPLFKNLQGQMNLKLIKSFPYKNELKQVNHTTLILTVFTSTQKPCMVGERNF
jgi:dihydrofolate reductase